MKFKRVFLLIIDSLGVGETLDAINFGDTGANTLGHVLEKEDLFIPNLKKIGFLDTLNMSDNNNVDAYYTIIKPASPSKDTLNAHYEMFGIHNTIPFKTFNQGFTFDILSAIEQITGIINNEVGFKFDFIKIDLKRKNIKIERTPDGKYIRRNKIYNEKIQHKSK